MNEKIRIFDSLHSSEDANAMFKMARFLVDNYSLEEGCQIINDLKLLFEAFKKSPGKPN